MRKSKKIILCICIVSILLTVMVVPCFAMWTYGNNGTEMNTYTNTLGIPFEVSVTGVSPSNYNLISTISDFGSLHYSTNFDYTTGIGNKYNSQSFITVPLNIVNFDNSRFLHNVIESYTINDGSTNFREFYNKPSTAKFTIDPLGRVLFQLNNNYPNLDLTDSNDYRTFRNFCLNNLTGNGGINHAQNGVVSGYTFSYDGLISSDSVLDTHIFDVFPYYLDVVQICDYKTVIQNGELNESYIDSLRYKIYYSFDVLYRDVNDNFTVQTVNGFKVNSLNGTLNNEKLYSAGSIRDVEYWNDWNYNYPEDDHDGRVYPLNIKLLLTGIPSAMRDYIENGVMGFRNLKFSVVGIDELADSNYNSTGNSYLQAYKNSTNNQPLSTCSLVYKSLSTQTYNNTLVDTPTFLYGDFDSEYESRREVVYLDNTFNPITWLGDTLGGVFNVDIFGSVSIGDILLVAIGCGFVLLILKFFAGG